MAARLYRPKQPPTETTTLDDLAVSLNIPLPIVTGLHRRGIIEPIGVNSDGLFLFNKAKTTAWLKFSGDVSG